MDIIIEKEVVKEICILVVSCGSRESDRFVVSGKLLKVHFLLTSIMN